MRIKNTLFVGKVFYELTSVDSTNRYAADLVSKNAPNEGTVVFTFHQTDGRGQIGSRWEGQPGKNIALSLILYPRFLEAQRQFLLNQAIALAASDTIARYAGKGVKVKWPNDIYIEDAKVAGILIQNTLAGRRLQASVAGIGLNVNQRTFPAGLDRAASLALVTGKNFDLYQIVESLCLDLEQRYLQLRAGRHEAMQHSYLQRLYRFRETAEYRTPAGEAFTGTIVGIDPAGKLLIATESGRRAFGLKEVQFW